MMNIKLSFVGYLELKGVTSGERIQVVEPISVADLLTGYKISKKHQRHIIPIVNGEEERLSYVLQEDDELTLFLPVGGG